MSSYKLPFTVSSLLFACSNVFALPISIGSIEGQLDTELSLKNQWATTKPDHYFIGSSNGGRGFASTSDNNRLNFKKGDSFSRLLKGKNRLHLKYQDYGLVVSAQYWYDFVEKNQRQSFANISDRGRYSNSRGSGAQWQEAFIYHHYQIQGKQGTVKLGRQYLNWGEEQFFLGGINIINPMDYREGWRPDMDTRAERVPVNLLSFSQQLTDKLSTDLFYQLDWRSDADANCNSFFAMTDYTTHGCSNNLRVLEGSNQLSAGDLNALNGLNITPEGILVRRTKDQRPKTLGQFGIAINYYTEPLGADLGFYAINYHSRTAFINGRTASQSAINQAAGLAQLTPSWLAGNGSYFMKYPENIHLYGVSFNKDIRADLTWRGEFSYRPNMPIQVSPVELFNTTTNGPIASIANQTIKGYDRKRVSQFQTSIIQTANEAMGAEEFKLTSAIGMIYVAGLDNQTLYGRDAVFGNAYNCSALTNYCEKNGFTTRFSWGYRIRGEWDYQNIFISRLSLKPSISWLHDIQGYSPSNEATFVEGRKALSLGLKAEYLRTYYVSLNYTNFFGGRYNMWTDRDFASLELGLKF